MMTVNGTSTGARVLGVLVMAGGVLCLTTPGWAGGWAVYLAGIVLALSGISRVMSWFRGRSDLSTGLLGGIGLIVAGVLFLSAGNLVAGAFGRLLALWLLAEAGRRLLALTRAEGRAQWLGNLVGTALALVLAGVAWRLSDNVALLAGLVAGVWLLMTGWEMAMRSGEAALPLAQARDRHPDGGLGIEPGEDLGRLNDTLARANSLTSGETLSWLLYFTALLFAAHAVRMQASLSIEGLIPSLVATAGDLFIAILIFWAVLLPVRLVWRSATRGIERRLWAERRAGVAAEDTDSESRKLADQLTGGWLDMRYRFAYRLSRARASLLEGLSLALGGGLIVAGLLVSINSIWGFSWYFNTENWASGVFQAVTGPRVDDWRQAMATAVAQEEGKPTDQAFSVAPEGLDGDFSFLVIGDPGEGDPSQLVLKDQILARAGDPMVKFVVLSSDIIYPAGEMKDYERNFYLPMKGLTKPVYAIPGNHDWFNALDAFNANLLTPDAALTSMRARAEVDHGLTLLSDAERQAMIAEAERLRGLYGIKAGLQTAPYFDVQTPDFALIAVDTGVLKTMDKVQTDWMKARLAAAKGKFVMVLAGHPRYAGGHDTAEPGTEFAGLYDMLAKDGVAVAMAGDTHDFEYYAEPVSGPRGVLHHFLNGGGGAYLSIGTALDWPKAPPTAAWAYYPSTAALTAKMNEATPGWKWPFWAWIRHVKAWPVSVETLSGIFDFNKAPFFQSFMEVQVSPSKGEVTYSLWGQDGPLRWRDLDRGGAMGQGAGPDAQVTVTLPLKVAGE